MFWPGFGGKDADYTGSADRRPHARVALEVESGRRHLSAILSVLGVIGAAMALARWSWRPIAVTLLPACCLVILTLLAAGMIGWLVPAANVLLFAGAALFAAEVYVQRRSPGAFLQPAVIVPALLLTAFTILNWGSILVRWDEFSHWGQILNYLHGTGHFPSEDGAVQFADYPFGTGLFQYFVSLTLPTSEQT